MSTPPAISVVLIVYNGERFLGEAIDSIVAQTTDTWELVAADDGSTDDTAAILDEYARRLGDRMRIVRHAGGVNCGMSASRNLGIRASRAPYVSFLDHDDVLLPEKLAEHAAILDREPKAAAVISPNLRWYSWADGSLSDETQDIGMPPEALAEPPGPLAVFLDRTMATPIGFTVRRSVLDEIGGYDEAFRGNYEDQVFLARLCLRHPVFIEGVARHKYRQHPKSSVYSSFNSGTRLLERRRFLRWLVGQLKDAGPESVHLGSIVRSELAKTRFARIAWARRQMFLAMARLAGRGA